MGPISSATGLDSSRRNGQTRNQLQQRRHWPPLVCPRCDSNNTRFCYYNNYSKSQPRHFCRTCRRHWTEGGTLRNVPVGGGRKNKRQKATTTTNSCAANADTDPSSLPLHQQQQKQTLPFRQHHGSIIFPEILRRVHFRPPELLPQAEYGITSSFMGSPPPPHFASTKPVIMNPYKNSIHPFSLSSNSSSYPFVPISEEGHSTSIDISMASTWQVAPPPPKSVPVSAAGVGAAVPCSGYWSSWEDDVAGRLRHNGAQTSQQ